METSTFKAVNSTDAAIPIDRKELVRRLGTSVPTLIRLEKKGIIPVIRYGGQVRYDWNKVMEALNKNSK